MDEIVEQQKNKKIKRIISLIYATIGILLFSAIAIFSSDSSPKQFKEYIIKHSDEIVKTEYGFRMPTFDGLYYQDITFKLITDSAYSFVLWGNRNSFLWAFKKDYQLVEDIPYRRYKKKDVELDIQILDILNEKKIQQQIK